MMINKIAKFHRFLVETGVARGVLALPAPSIDYGSDIDKGTLEIDVVFDRIIEEEEIISVCRDLFDSGHYNIAVHESYKVVDNYIKNKSTKISQSGTALMDIVFSPKNPMLVWNDRETTSQKDHQAGYHRLYSGAMLAIRNPTGHEFNWIDNAEDALECIVFAQHLLRQAKKSYRPVKATV
ncbi:TIGR02391 family protein [Glycocaulis profundi]|nr:TIGR02391 family protein [Glycocaulis profundi]